MIQTLHVTYVYLFHHKTKQLILQRLRPLHGQEVTLIIITGFMNHFTDRTSGLLA